MWYMINMDNLLFSYKMYKIYGNVMILESENIRIVMVYILKVFIRKLSIIKY